MKAAYAWMERALVLKSFVQYSGVLLQIGMLWNPYSMTYYIHRYLMSSLAISTCFKCWSRVAACMGATVSAVSFYKDAQFLTFAKLDSFRSSSSLTFSYSLHFLCCRPLYLYVLVGQLGWRAGDEGNVFIAEPLFMSKVWAHSISRCCGDAPPLFTSY